jgi:pyruvate/oxaloacetate carboxyltransferase
VLAQVEKQTGKKTVTGRPADLLEPGMEKYRGQCADKGLPTDDETVVLFAMFPQQVEALLKPKASAAAKPPAAAAPAPASAPAPSLPPRPANGNARHMFVTVEGRRHEVTVETLEG